MKKEKKQLNLNKHSRQWIVAFYDVIIYAIATTLLLVIYDGNTEFDLTSVLYQFFFGGVFIFLSRFICRVYKQILRFGGIQCYIRLLMADGIAFVVFYVIEMILALPPFGISHFSFSRILAISCMALLGSLAMRMVYRYAYKCRSREDKLGRLMRFFLRVFARVKKGAEAAEDDDHKKAKIAIIGAGSIGVDLAETFITNKNSNYNPVCFIDISKEKTGRQIFGLPVYSEEKMTAAEFREKGIHDIVFAFNQDDAEKKRELYEHYSSMGLKVKVYDYPRMQQAGNKKRYLREFDIEELLFRPTLDVTNDATKAFYSGKVVLITGGGGSIGSELCRQIATMSPKQLIILDVYENGAYQVQQELRIAYGASLNLAIEILSVCNRQALEKVFDTYRPQIVIHAAAHKHVPLMEHNCCEAIENNVFGTLNTVELSEKYRVERFMMVSTDKAVNPTNVMGATKRMCEMIVQSHSRTSTYTTYSATRFGNVLGSAGSVIPLFKIQIQNGGPITLTDKRIIRYFMTIPEASKLVLQSASMAKNGELFVLDMGKPVKILNLAESMIRLSGFVPYHDIDIVEVGLRPGEKLYEELLVKTEELDKTENSMIFIERDEPISAEELNLKLAALGHAVDIGDDEAAKEALHKVVPTFKRPEDVNASAMSSEEMAESVKN